MVSVVLLDIPIVDVGVTEVDGKVTIVVPIAYLDLVGSRRLGLVFSKVPVSLGLVGSNTLVDPTTAFKLSNVNCVMVLGIQQNTALNSLHNIYRLPLTWHFRILSSPLQVRFLIWVLINM
jgi:hypothetical protein